MSRPLKDLLDEEAVRSISADLRRAWPPFRSRSFVAACLHGLAGLELTGRAWHVAAAMRDHLPERFAEAADVVVRSLGPALPGTTSLGLSTLRYMPHAFLVQRWGLGDFEASMRYQRELTRRFTAESSIRAFLVEHPEATLARLREWALDPDPHVRRLVSEGTRPRLPWTPRLRAFQSDPRPVLELLELLRDDPERYVQRSVANSLNDVAKDHPGLAVETCRCWMRDATPGRAWIVRHALRVLVKQGDPAALEVLGVGAPPRVRVEAIRIAPRRARIGEEVRFSLRLVSTAREAQRLEVDHAVHFVKASGAARPKVFKLRRLELGAAEQVELSGRISLVQMSTRTHHPGRHRLELRVNGRVHALGSFEVRAAGPGRRVSPARPSPGRARPRRR